jgi:hypothetical protein
VVLALVAAMIVGACWYTGRSESRTRTLRLAPWRWIPAPSPARGCRRC